MLMDDLLLDSARTFGNDQNKENTDTSAIRCPKMSPLGVPYSWYALRVSYSRELKVQAHLQAMGVRTFVPMMWKKIELAGQVEKKLVPAINNLCFVYWTKSEIDEYIKGFGEKSPVHYYWDTIEGRPLKVSDSAMKDFIAVASMIDEDLVYLRDINGKLREGEKVIVKGGPFKGVHGTVVRVRKSRRIMVEIPGMLAVASAYVPLNDLKILL